MKTQTSLWAVSLFIFILLSGFVYSSQADISGTWVGETDIPDQGTDEMTLILERSNGDYTGTISDSFGMLMDAECEDLQYDNETLSFKLTIYDGYSDLTVHITLKVEGDSMSGHWETEDGNTGEISMTRQTG